MKAEEIRDWDEVEIEVKKERELTATESNHIPEEA